MNVNNNQVKPLSKILVAVDYLNLTSEIFQKACELSKKNDSKLMIFHCVAQNLHGVQDLKIMGNIATYGGVYSSNMLALEEELIKETTDELTKWIHSFCKEAKKLNIEAKCDYSIGEAGQQICAKAQAWNADLIIIGRRGYNGFQEILVGSVSNYVVHHAHCSVLIVQY